MVTYNFDINEIAHLIEIYGDSNWMPAIRFNCTVLSWFHSIEKYSIDNDIMFSRSGDIINIEFKDEETLTLFKLKWL